MQIQIQIYDLPKIRKIIVLKDEQGNVSTGVTYIEALEYLIQRRKLKKNKKNEERKR